MEGNIKIYIPSNIKTAPVSKLYGIKFQENISEVYFITRIISIQEKDLICDDNHFLGYYKGEQVGFRNYTSYELYKDGHKVLDHSFNKMFIILYDTNFLQLIIKKEDIIPKIIYHTYFKSSGVENSKLGFNKCATRVQHSLLQYSHMSNFLINIDISFNRYTRTKLITKDTTVMDMLNIILGLTFLYILSNYCGLQQTIDLISYLMERIACTLHDILYWLMGIPSGLKLVKPLTSSLGNFFVFHIKLWTDYVRLAWPILARLIYAFRFISCFGLTYIMALILDILSILTLHIYCIYIYAAKIYSLVIRAIISLFRLFHGKKWNALRRRVDHATYELDQLFMGTLIFTILLFIFPSIFVFYAVFVGLRLINIMVYVILSLLSSLFLNFPIYTLMSRILSRFNSKFTIGDTLYFDMISQEEHCVFMKIKVSPKSLKKVLEDYLISVMIRMPNINGTLFLSSLLTGTIIYPKND